jgi:hypothetical protein
MDKNNARLPWTIDGPGSATRWQCACGQLQHRPSPRQTGMVAQSCCELTDSRKGREVAGGSSSWMNGGGGWILVIMEV